MIRTHSVVFSPSEGNLGGLYTVSTQLIKHKAAINLAKPRINSLSRPHPHVDEKPTFYPKNTNIRPRYLYIALICYCLIYFIISSAQVSPYGLDFK